MSDTVFMKSEFMREINEHKESFSGSEHMDYIDAYVAKMETEKNNEESSFSVKNIHTVHEKHFLHYPLKILFFIVPKFVIMFDSSRKPNPSNTPSRGTRISQTGQRQLLILKLKLIITARNKVTAR